MKNQHITNLLLKTMLKKIGYKNNKIKKADTNRLYLLINNVFLEFFYIKKVFFWFFLHFIKRFVKCTCNLLITKVIITVLYRYGLAERLLRLISDFS